jgi:hypothetical protein
MTEIESKNIDARIEQPLDGLAAVT